ncbi:MAG: enolase C-terminal domain-like protein [Chloroflexota bacterium]
MKITEVKIQVIQRDPPPKEEGVLGYASGATSTAMELMEAPVVVIRTDEGIEGISCGRSGLALAQYVARLRPHIIGENPLYIEKLWQKLVALNRTMMYPPPALGVIDIALWDIAGKVANLPLYKLLGACRSELPAYASSTRRSSIDAYVRHALESKAQGFTAYKHKPLSWGKVEVDLELCRAIRDAVGKEMRLMFDPVAIYSPEDALRLGRGLEKLGYYWLEEPIPDRNMQGLARLCASLDIPIAALEASPGDLEGIASYLVAGAVDIVRSDALHHGGITQLLKVAHLSEAFGARCEIHTCSNPIANTANLHVSCAIKNCEYYEWWMPEKLLWDFGVVKPSLKVEKGMVKVPEGAGLGLELDWDYIKAHTIATL